MFCSLIDVCSMLNTIHWRKAITLEAKTKFQNRQIQNAIFHIKMKEDGGERKLEISLNNCVLLVRKSCTFSK
jgi:hypothetical protein